jgi:hypothetical protein
MDTQHERTRMRRRSDGRRVALGAASLAVLALSLALSLPFTAQALLKPGKPRVTTGGVTHVRSNSGQLEGTVNPAGFPTSYYFQYGPAIAYGGATQPASLAAGATGVRVGQTVIGLLPGYHYRLVATNAVGTTLGADRVFTPKAVGNVIEVPKGLVTDVYGSPFLLTGRITGTGAAGRKVVVQSSPFPYLEPFATVSTAAVTNAAGSFSFRVTNLLRNAELRVGTLDARPLYSAVMHVQVAVRVSFHARSAGHGLVRLYGTVTPALSGALVRFQVSKPVRPGKSEKTTAFVTQFTAKVKHATHSFSRFSTVVRLRHSGNYRALVKPREASLATGSSAHLKLRAPTTSSKAKGK